MKPSTVACPHCSREFIQLRSSKKFCSGNCRKGAYQKKDRAKNPRNSTSSPTTRQDNRVLLDTAARLAEHMYGLPPAERTGFIRNLITEGRAGNQQVKNICHIPVLAEASVDHPKAIVKLVFDDFVSYGSLIIYGCILGNKFRASFGFGLMISWVQCLSFAFNPFSWLE